MKKALALMAVVLGLGLVAVEADAAKRLGGGKSAGMQRQNTTQPAQSPSGGNQPDSPAQTAPAAAAAPAAGAAAAAAATPKRSWMGPIAGIAAGLGIAALASHLGFGEALANMLVIGLLVMAALAVVGFFLRKRAMGQQPAMGAAGAGNLGAFGGLPGQQRTQVQPSALRSNASSESGGGSQIGSMIGTRLGGGLTNSAALGARTPAIPADFDKAGFERNAKVQFVALQEANDFADLDRLGRFLSPEMFEVVQADLRERGDAPQKTEVFGLEAQVLEVAEEAERYVVSVRFTGSVRHEPGVAPDDLDEVWHLTKSRSGFDGWTIAGIQQTGRVAA